MMQPFPGRPAFGEILPTAGTNNLSYTGRMGGTSAACPQVSAVAALILSVNNTLTQQQVFDIITQSAEKVGGYTYNANGWSPELGNGRLNACAALSRIPNRYIVNGNDPLCVNATYAIAGLPLGSTISWGSSNNSIATISSTGVATKVGNGNVTFTASINIPNRCGTSTATKTILVGLGDPIFEQKTIICPPGNQYSIAARVTNIPSATLYSWYIDGILKTTSSGNSATVPGGLANGTSHTLQAKIQMSCGLSLTALPEGRYSARCGGGGTLLKVSPNPTSNTLNVETTGEENFTEIRIFDKLGNLRKEFKILKTNKTSINLADLPIDTYTIQVFDGTDWTTTRFVKN